MCFNISFSGRKDIKKYKKCMGLFLRLLIAIKSRSRKKKSDNLILAYVIIIKD